MKGVFDLFGWLNLLVALGGAAVSTLALGRSRWAMVLLGGFVGEASVSLLYRIQGLFGTIGSGSLESVYLVTTSVSLAARIAIVVGVRGLLASAPPAH